MEIDIGIFRIGARTLRHPERLRWHRFAIAPGYFLVCGRLMLWVAKGIKQAA